MSAPGRVRLMLFGQAAHIAWCTTGLSEKNITERFFVEDSIGLSQVLRENHPEIALIACHDAATCNAVIAVCRRANPGIQLIVIDDKSRNIGPKLVDGESLFAVLNVHDDGIDLIAVLKKAIAFVLQRRALQEQGDRRALRRHFPAQWLIAQESMQRDGKLEFATSLIRNILHSASQGLGIGAVLTYLDLMAMTMTNAQKENEVFSSLMRNAHAARAWLSAFENILNGLQKHYPREVVHSAELGEIIESAIAQVDKFRAVRGQDLETHDLEYQGGIEGNREALKEILSELLLNAYKYSPAKSLVRIQSYSTSEYTAITIINDAEQMGGGITGIPREYEEKVFEPFFRMNNTLDDRFIEQKYGLGIGLTLAEHAAQECGGRLYLYDIEGPDVQKGIQPAHKQVVAELVLQKVKDV